MLSVSVRSQCLGSSRGFSHLPVALCCCLLVPACFVCFTATSYRSRSTSLTPASFPFALSPSVERMRARRGRRLEGPTPPWPMLRPSQSRRAGPQAQARVGTSEWKEGQMSRADRSINRRTTQLGRASLLVAPTSRVGDECVDVARAARRWMAVSASPVHSTRAFGCHAHSNVAQPRCFGLEPTRSDQRFIRRDRREEQSSTRGEQLSLDARPATKLFALSSHPQASHTLNETCSKAHC